MYCCDVFAKITLEHLSIARDGTGISPLTGTAESVVPLSHGKVVVTKVPRDSSGSRVVERNAANRRAPAAHDAAARISRHGNLKQYAEFLLYEVGS